jgi:hypothetical protein
MSSLSEDAAHDITGLFLLPLGHAPYLTRRFFTSEHSELHLELCHQLLVCKLSICSWKLQYKQILYFQSLKCLFQWSAANFTGLSTTLSPVPTFIRIVKNRSTEKFSCFPYLSTLLANLVWLIYGLVTPGSMAVVVSFDAKTKASLAIG